MYAVLALIGFPLLFFLAARHEGMPNAWQWATGSALVSLVVLRAFGLLFILPAQGLLYVGLWVYNTKHKQRRGEKWAAQVDERRQSAEARRRWADEQIARERAERARRERDSAEPQG